ncbi:hypothetical protein ACFGVR_17945 [Mucilaginibacter sp. AW1-3]
MNITLSVAQNQPDDIKLNWLNSAPKTQNGVSWGIPWPQGKVKATANFTLTADGKSMPLQSWPLAYWPDGSIKWTAFASVGDSAAKNVSLSITSAKAIRSMAIRTLVADDGNTIHVNTGNMQCDIAKKGNILIPAVNIGSKPIAIDGKLEAIVQNQSDGDIDATPVKQKFISSISNVKVEQTGPVRAVVRIDGHFKSVSGSRELLRFIVRLYFYQNTDNIRLVHTLIFDGDDQKDFIKGLGLTFSVPFREELQNRHVRFSGEGDGVWAEPVQPLNGRRPGPYQDQAAGKLLPGVAASPNQKALYHEMASWNDYKLVQGSADGFNIQKRTNGASSWLDVNGGKRATGLAFAGDVSGGLAVGLKNFWQSYPAALEINDARMATAKVKIWFWSPYSDAMDMRHYDTVAHSLDITYEDVQKGYSTPHGIARTSEVMIYPYAALPSNQQLADNAAATNNPTLLVATPQYLHSVGALGMWSLPDRSTKGKQWIEDQLDKAIAFYQGEIDRREWYGFWNYGDVMHSYDAARHTWKYDIGGFAWDNTELSTDIWLWYSFLRTGRADIFKMAEAMTRHTSEVDLYHLGPFAGLGSRHNVNHWGDGSKEVRESQAILRRFYYYLSTDERTGEIMHESAMNADSGLAHVDPLREILPKDKFPTHARFGPDWVGLVGNWMTEWERTGDIKWKNKILVGVNDFTKMPYGFYSNKGKDGGMGYDPKTNHIYQMAPQDIGNLHLATLMGGMEMAYELTPLLNNKDWSRMYLQYCALYGAPAEEFKAAFGVSIKLGDNAGDYARQPGYAYYITKDPKFAKRAWDEFLPSTQGRFGGGPNKFDSKLLTGPAVLKPLYEIRNVSTNSTSQWCLNAIELLQMAGDAMPEHNIAWDK